MKHRALCLVAVVVKAAIVSSCFSASVQADTPPNGIRVESITAKRSRSGGISITGVIENISAPAVTDAGYVISRKKGSSWSPVKSGSVGTVAAHGHVTVTAEIPSTNKMVDVKLEVTSGGKVRAKVVSLAAKLNHFTVHYKPQGWVLIRVETGEVKKSTGTEATALSHKMNSLGFKTKSERKTFNKIFGNDTYRITVRAIAEKELTWTFDTKAKANAFKDELQKILEPRTVNRDDSPPPFQVISLVEHS